MAAKSSFPGGAPADCPRKAPAGPRGAAAGVAGIPGGPVGAWAAAASAGAVAGGSGSSSASARGSSGSTNKPLRLVVQPFFSLMGARTSSSFPGPGGMGRVAPGNCRNRSTGGGGGGKRRAAAVVGQFARVPRGETDPLPAACPAGYFHLT